MTVKILVVDDSVTMRKIVEMTFAAEKAEVRCEASVDAGLAALDGFGPDVVFADLSMSPDGYELAKAVKAKRPQTAVIALFSQHTPYDAAKGTASGVDEAISKPYDSTVVINKLAEVLQRPRVAPGASAAAPAPAAAAPAAAQPKPPIAAVPSQSAIPLAAGARDMKRTMAFGMPLVGGPTTGPVQGTPVAPGASAPQPAAAPAPAPAAAAPKPAPVVAAPTPAAPAAAPVVAAPKPAAAAPVAQAAVAAASAGLAGKLAGLGLTKEQVEGVLALSREVVEQVVWEVVPELAETIIKEEIKRLTSA